MAKELSIIQKKYQRGLTINAFSTVILASTGAILYYYNIRPEVPSGVFESLLQVLATLIGFGVVIIVYLLGKFDDYEQRYLAAYYSANNYSRQLREKVIEIRAKYEGQDTTKSKTISEAFSEYIKKVPERLKSLQTFRDNILSGVDSMRIITIRSGISILLNYGVGIAFSISAIMFLPSHIDSTFIVLLSVVSFIFNTTYEFVNLWQIRETFLIAMKGMTIRLNDFAYSDLDKVLDVLLKIDEDVNDPK